jgi:hypothetical protein
MKRTFWQTGFGKYVMNNLLAIDQRWNAWAGGSPDETISSRLGRIEEEHGGKIPWYRPLSRLVAGGLDAIDPGHCHDAIEHDEVQESKDRSVIDRPRRDVYK